MQAVLFLFLLPLSLYGTVCVTFALLWWVSAAAVTLGGNNVTACVRRRSFFGRGCDFSGTKTCDRCDVCSPSFSFQSSQSEKEGEKNDPRVPFKARKEKDFLE